MKETNHDKDCRKLTRLIKDNSESENKLAGHSHDKINSKENTKNEQKNSRKELNIPSQLLQ